LKLSVEAGQNYVANLVMSILWLLPVLFSLNIYTVNVVVQGSQKCPQITFLAWHLIYNLYLPLAMFIPQVLVGPSKQLKQIIQIENNIVKNPNVFQFYSSMLPLVHFCDKFHAKILICVTCVGQGFIRVTTSKCFMGLALKSRCGSLSQMLQWCIFKAWTFSDQQGIFFNSSEQLKQRFSFLQLKYRDLYSVLDAAKVCSKLALVRTNDFSNHNAMLIRLVHTELL